MSSIFLELWEKRDGRASALDTDPKRLYETLRGSLGGSAVATIRAWNVQHLPHILANERGPKSAGRPRAVPVPYLLKDPVGRVIHVPPTSPGLTSKGVTA